MNGSDNVATSSSALVLARQEDNVPQDDHHHAGGAVADLPGPIVPYLPRADISTLPTIFPPSIASVISSVATSARVSLRISAFLIEAILETSEYSTKMSLSYTRRLLIAAISSARRVYLVGNGELELHSLLGGGAATGENSDLGSKSSTTTSSDPFLSVLDRYTNLGVYLIHHTFTMAELFAVSGFFLTASAFQSFHQTAHDSVALFDSLFGSNESSRTLSAIIAMVRKEVLLDERRGEKSTLASLAGLTKAMTAFACLQAATWQRTSKRLKMKVLYDCTVLAQRSDSFVASSSAQTQDEPRPLSLAALGDIAGPGPSTAEARQRQTEVQHGFSLPLDEANRRLRAHAEAAESRSQSQANDITLDQGAEDTSDWSMDDLDDLVGESGDEVYDGPPNELSRALHRQRRSREARLEITDELTESTVVTQMLERVHPDGRRYRSSPLPRRHLSLEDVPARDCEPSEGPERSANSSVMTSPRSDSLLLVLADEEENDWIEVDHLLNEGEDGIPSIPNGASPVGASSYLDALEHPHHNAERFQVVLKTMTNKLLQRKRTVRHVTRVSRSEASDSEVTVIQLKPSSERERIPGGRRNAREVDWDRTPRPGPSRQRRPRSKSTTNSEGTPNSKRPSLPSPPTSPPRSGGKSRRSTADKALAKARNILLLPRAKDSNASTPTATRNPSPSPRRRRPPPGPLIITPPNEPMSPDEGFRAPPPSPHNSLVPRSPLAELTDAAHQTDPVSRQYGKTAPPPESSSSRSHTSTPSLSTVHEAVHTSSSRIQSASSRLMPERGDASSDSLFPHEGLIKNIHRFMRYSSAAYGQNFLRILGLGSSDFLFPSTGKHHANSWAFAQHTNIPIDCLLLSSFTESSATLLQQEAPPLIHYVAVAHDLKAVVLTCRGTLGLSDVLVDLTCEYQSIHVDKGDPEASYYVHAGMWQSARKLIMKQSTVHQTLVDALTKYPTYGLVLAGHSLGGGVAALLAILSSMPSRAFLEHNLSLPPSSQATHPTISTPFVTSIASGLPPGRPIHCYAYGPPAVTSPDLASYSKGLITSIVQDSDVVPTLSLGAVKDFKNIALTLSEEDNIAEEIVGRVIGIYKRKFGSKNSNSSSDQTFNSTPAPAGSTPLSPEPSDEESLSDWMVSLIKTMRADMDHEKLYPPGMVYIMEHFAVFVDDDVVSPPGSVPASVGGKKRVQKQAHRVILRHCESVEERFREPVFAKSMLQNHLPSQYERSTGLLYEGLGQGML